jgi:hypothetical protein
MAMHSPAEILNQILNNEPRNLLTQQVEGVIEEAIWFSKWLDKMGCSSHMKRIGYYYLVSDEVYELWTQHHKTLKQLATCYKYESKRNDRQSDAGHRKSPRLLRTRRAGYAVARVSGYPDSLHEW